MFYLIQNVDIINIFNYFKNGIHLSNINEWRKGRETNWNSSNLKSVIYYTYS